MNISDFLQFLFRLTVSSNQLLRDITALRNEIQPLKEKLIPFSNEEMELLSLNQSNVTKKRGFNKQISGIFDTIYFEHLIAYTIKEYSNHQQLILITTTTDEFVYLVKPDKTHIYLNNVETGILTKDGKLISLRNKLLGSIDGADHLPTHRVIINEKDYGFIANPRKKDHTTPRAFNLLKPMNNDEKLIFLCLTLVNLVEESQLPKV